MAYPNLLLQSDEIKFSPTILVLAPLRSAVCSYVPGTETGRFITLRKVHMDIRGLEL